MTLTYAIISLITLGTAYILLKSSREQKLPTLMILVIMLITLLIYFYIGNPDYPDQPYEKLKAQEQSLHALSTDELIQRYEDGLKQKDTVQARIVLANTLARLGKLQQAKKHFQMAYQMDNHNTPDISISYVDILIALNKGIVSDEAYKIIDISLKKDSTNPRGLLYQGLWLAQHNDIKKATQIWQDLVKKSKDKSYYQSAINNLASVISYYNIEPEIIGLENNSKITKDDLPMIENMVKSLEEKVKQDPNNKALKERLDDVQIKFKNIKDNI